VSKEILTVLFSSWVTMIPLFSVVVTFWPSPDPIPANEGSIEISTLPSTSVKIIPLPSCVISSVESHLKPMGR